MKDKQKLQGGRLGRLAPSNQLVSRFELVIGALDGEALAVFGSGRRPGKATLAPHGLRPYKARCWP